MNTTPEFSTTRQDQRKQQIQVEAGSKMKPRILEQLNDWQYLEQSIHRLICAWGRHFRTFEDKTSVHRHVWDQAECVRRLRSRIEQFVGGNPDKPVSNKLEKLANTVLLAPTFEDAIDGIYQILSWEVARSYIDYFQNAHLTHDAPTIQVLQEIVTIKEQHRLWLREYRRRHPHSTHRTYVDSIYDALKECGNLRNTLPPTDPTAKPAGLQTSFKLLKWSAREDDWHLGLKLYPYLEADFAGNIETRRLFWAYGYQQEMNLADDQLIWLYSAHYMPWDFIYDLSRHMWDESRHGESGHSRLLDFGITTKLIGFPYYVQPKPPVLKNPAEMGFVDLLTPADLYEQVFGIGMVAETGHFEVKNEAYQDFRDGGDFESAEMMLFDIIDETTHLQYAHRWLPLLAKHSEKDHSDYKARALRIRRERQENLLKRVEDYQHLPRDFSDPSYRRYQELLGMMREKLPLSNAKTCPPRSPKPM